MCSNLFVFRAVLLAVLMNSVSSLQTWSYKEDEPGLFGPSQWGRVNPFCDGRRQSPIDFQTAVKAHGYPIIIHNIHKQPSSSTTRNDGHGFAMMLNFNDGTKLAISGGPLENDIYYLHDFHIHWGSEHTINGERFDAELNLVHYNSKYPDIKTALERSDGITVLGVIFKLDRSRNGIRPIISSALRVKEHGTPDHIETDPQNLFSLFEFLGRKTFKVWSYLGSLTTPNCSEVVTWMVSRNSLPIYESELTMLKQMQSDHKRLIDENRRPTQPLNGRVVRQFG